MVWPVKIGIIIKRLQPRRLLRLEIARTIFALEMCLEERDVLGIAAKCSIGQITQNGYKAEGKVDAEVERHAGLHAGGQAAVDLLDDGEEPVGKDEVDDVAGTIDCVSMFVIIELDFEQERRTPG